MNRFPLIIPALKIKQTFNEFYAVSISAYDLLQICFSDPMRYNDEGTVIGLQRKIDHQKRVKEITAYIQSTDFAFPNSIIIAANYTEEGIIESNYENRWEIIDNKNQNYKLKIPKELKLASIIDGQHRLEGFRKTDEEFQKNTDLLVSVYFDLPNPFQAYLFATINYNQKPVDKSLALEQYGFQTDVTPKKTWSPELLAVFLTKKLNKEDDSPFRGKIKMAPIGSEQFIIKSLSSDWSISTACLVRGILNLFSKNPRKDSNELKKYEIEYRNRNQLHLDDTPLREFYLNENDLFIYKTIVNFFIPIRSLIFNKATESSFIKKSVGIDALFLVLKKLLSTYLQNDKNISINYFNEFVKKIEHIDFSNNFFSASATGTNRIANTILISLNLIKIDSIKKEEDREQINTIIIKKT